MATICKKLPFATIRHIGRAFALPLMVSTPHAIIVTIVRLTAIGIGITTTVPITAAVATTVTALTAAVVMRIFPRYEVTVHDRLVNTPNHVDVPQSVLSVSLLCGQFFTVYDQAIHFVWAHVEFDVWAVLFGHRDIHASVVFFTQVNHRCRVGIYLPAFCESRVYPEATLPLS